MMEELRSALRQTGALVTHSSWRNVELMSRGMGKAAALRWLAVIVPLTVVLVLAVIAARHFARAQPGMIDYDRPGVDITAEGPEAFTDQWYKWR